MQHFESSFRALQDSSLQAPARKQTKAKAEVQENTVAKVEASCMSFVRTINKLNTDVEAHMQRSKDNRYAGELRKDS